jgi:hypothetical protein
MTTKRKASRTDCQLLQKLLEDACRRLAAEHGADVTCDNVSCDDNRTSFTLRIRAGTPDDLFQPSDKRADVFRRHAAEHGLDEDDLGREFETCFRRFVILGLSHSHDNQIITRCREDGKMYKFPSHQVRWMLGK